jgi:hypothetical protein
MERQQMNNDNDTQATNKAFYTLPSIKAKYNTIDLRSVPTNIKIVQLTLCKNDNAQGVCRYTRRPLVPTGRVGYKAH